MTGYPPVHLPLPQRKALCGRITVLEATQSRVFEFARTAGKTSYEAFRERAFHLSDKEIHFPRDDTSLDRFLGHFVDQLSQDVKPFTREVPVLQDLLDSVKHKARAVSCSACSPLETVCNGGSQDDLMVSQGGRCIEALHRMFQLARNITLDYYARFSTLFAQLEQQPQIVLSTAFTTRKPHDLPRDYYVSGVTYYGASYGAGAGAGTEIQLLLQVEKFDWPTYLGALYVLFHELVVHALQGSYPAPDGRQPSQPDDDFAEGWMDWIACKIMERSLIGERLEWPSADDYLDVARNFSLAKYDYHSADRSVHALRCAMGVETARRLQHFLQRLTGCAEQAWQLLLRLSFDLTLLRLSTIERQRLVGYLHKCLPRRGRHKKPSHYAALTPVLKRYVKHQEAVRLYQDLRELIGQDQRAQRPADGSLTAR